jgi:hypothetical protein
VWHEINNAHNDFIDECGFSSWKEKVTMGEDLGEPLRTEKPRTGQRA